MITPPLRIIDNPFAPLLRSKTNVFGGGSRMWSEEYGLELLPGFASGVNDARQAIGQFPFPATGGFFYESGQAITFQDLLPETFRQQLRNTVPSLISEVDPQTGYSTILFSAESLEGEGDQEAWVRRDFTLKKASPGAALTAEEGEGSMLLAQISPFDFYPWLRRKITPQKAVLTRSPAGAPAVALPAIPVTINVFIPHEFVSNNFNHLMIFRPNILEGDNRAAGVPLRAVWDENGSYRTQLKFNVIADQSADSNGLQNNAFVNGDDGIKDDDHFIGIGTSRQYDRASSVNGRWRLTAAARADTQLGDAYLKMAEQTGNKDQLTVTTEWLGARKVAITCFCAAYLPLVPTAPAIDYTFTIIIDRTDPAYPTYTLTGQHDGFPAYEIYINHTRVHHHDPIEADEGPTSLIGTGKHSVSHINRPLP